MNALARRLRALEAAAAKRPGEDTPEARAVSECLAGLFEKHAPDGALRQQYDTAPDAPARAVVVCDLLDRAGTDAERELLHLIARAEGRPGVEIN